MSKTPIMGKSVVTAEQMAAHLLAENPAPKIEVPALTLCQMYLLLGELEGVRGDLEFARSCWETNYFRFTGTVVPEQKNFCGHGTVSATEKGTYFPDEATAILAQIQHAKGYASTEALLHECVDSRYKYVKLGSAPTMEKMGGKWAVPGYDTKKYSSLEEANAAEDSYGYKILGIMNRILGKTEEEKKPEVKSKPLEGIYICLDAGHYKDVNKCPSIPEYSEAKVMWELHLMLKKYLEEMGAKVLLTRPDQNTDKQLYIRGAYAKGCNLFLSLHSNAVGNGMNENIDYVAVYHLTEDASATCDDVSEEVAQVIAPVIANVMGTKQGYKVLTRKSSNDRNGDGVMNDNYYGVLNGARLVDVPALILEHSFHTNSKTVRWLLQDSNLDHLAHAEAEAIASYFANNVKTEDEAQPSKFCIRVANVEAGDVLNIREEPRHDADKTGALAYNDPNKYTIVEVQNGWGKLKSGIGWINLDYTVRV